ncbi:MAG: inosine/xanthosine triphosphatase [Nitrososphaerota archaeon]|nr:inosine/xanthosine triphosphatase [Nitrososphaerota archaeon]MDG6916077.1 inosine/xanthosine triphosphatase [Nitrososphaerota archaeon]MDG6919425.1 inosine/xanthosine triphosphatase [Nitrososphaerota archaeon]
MIVALGSMNPAKIEGVRRAFTMFFPSVEVRPIDPAAVSKAQPRGLDEMTEGATARARFALSQVDGDFGVGVEAGIFTIGEVYFDNQIAAIADGSGRVTLGHSAGYSLPREAMERLFAAGEELERWAEKVSGVYGVGDKGGLIHYLTNGKVSRADLTEQCVVTALVPWLHRDVYNF